MEQIRTGSIDAVIVSVLDRIGRSTRLVLRLVEEMNQYGVELVSCKESLDTSTPSGRFVLRMFASLAELERDNIVERTTAGRDARGMIDGEKGGRVPLGYVRTENGIQIDPVGAAVVRRTYNRKREGDSLRKITQELNVDGVKTPRGGNWSHGAIRVVLDNEEKYSSGQRGDSIVQWQPIICHKSLQIVNGRS